MTQVIVKDNFDQAILELRRKIGREGILNELRDRRYYLSRRERRRQKDSAALLRNKKHKRPDNWQGGRSD